MMFSWHQLLFKCSWLFLFMNVRLSGQCQWIKCDIICNPSRETFLDISEESQYPVSCLQFSKSLHYILRQSLTWNCQCTCGNVLWGLRATSDSGCMALWSLYRHWIGYWNASLWFLGKYSYQFFLMSVQFCQVVCVDVVLIWLVIS